MCEKPQYKFLLKRKIATIVLTCVLSILAINVAIAQGNHKRKKSSSGTTTIGLSYGWAIGDGGLKSSLFTFHMLFPKQKGRFLEIETQYYRYSDNEDYFNEDGDVIGVADVLDWHIESRIKFARKLIEAKRLEVQLNPFIPLYYRQGEWLPRSPNAVPKLYKQFGLGLGLEIRPVYHITDRVGVYTAISYQVLELLYDKRQNLNPILPINRQQSAVFSFDLFGNRLFWTVGALYSFN